MSTFAVAGCNDPAVSSTADQKWSGLVSSVRVQWRAETGIDLLTGVAVPARAYLESYDLVQYTGSLANSYPGFVEAVPENESSEATDNSAAWSRRPSEDVAVVSALIGTLQYHLLAVNHVGTEAEVTVCSYNYGVAEEQPDGKYRQLPTNGSVEDRGVFGIRLQMAAPDERDEAELPPQAGAALAPSNNVFQGWQVLGYSTTSATPLGEWPDRDDVRNRCIARAPDPLDTRKLLADGTHPASAFPAAQPIPGWPETPS
jgi:hypothetical protein